MRSSRPSSPPPDLARDPQALDDPVADGVGEPGLEPVEGLAEPAAHLVVERELVERVAQRLGAAGAEPGQRVGQRQPGAHGGGEVVDGLGPDLGELPLPPPGAAGHHGDREVAAHQPEGDATGGVPRDELDHQGGTRPRARAHSTTKPVDRDLAQPGAVEQLAQPDRARRVADPRRARQEERGPDQQQPDADPESDQRAHQPDSPRIGWTSMPTRS